jgi:hypothetical protein
MASWLSAVDIPLFVSHRRLAPRRALPVASAAWALDSGGFTELNLHGCWQSTEREYVVAVGRYRAEVGRLSWAAPMDWMCEPFVVAKTGLSVREHQHRTVGNFLKLRELAPDLSFIPVLQGWTESDYHNCLALYDNAGVDLVAEPLVGIGSICRRQHHSEIGPSWEGWRSWAFGFTGSGSSSLDSSTTPGLWPQPTRWPGATTLVEARRFVAAPTGAAPTASPTLCAGGAGHLSGSPASGSNRCCRSCRRRDTCPLLQRRTHKRRGACLKWCGAVLLKLQLAHHLYAFRIGLGPLAVVSYLTFFWVCVFVTTFRPARSSS